MSDVDRIKDRCMLLRLKFLAVILATFWAVPYVIHIGESWIIVPSILTGLVVIIGSIEGANAVTDREAKLLNELKEERKRSEQASK